MPINVIARAVLGILFLSIMDSMIKGVAVRYPVAQVGFLRFAFGVVVVGAVVAYARPGWPSSETIRVNAARSLLSVTTAVLFFYALGAMPLAETIALSFLSPIFLAVFGVVLLGERGDRRVVMALLIGFVGMICIVFGGGGSGAPLPMLGILAALGSALTYSLAMALLRSRAQRDRVEIIVFIQHLGPALILALPALYVWQPVLRSDLLIFTAMGGLGTIGHLLLASAFARAEASRLAPFEYTALVWATLLGVVFFDEWPRLATIAGAGLIVVGTVLAARGGKRAEGAPAEPQG